MLQLLKPVGLEPVHKEEQSPNWQQLEKACAQKRGPSATTSKYIDNNNYRENILIGLNTLDWINYLIGVKIY